MKLKCAERSVREAKRELRSPCSSWCRVKLERSRFWELQVAGSLYTSRSSPLLTQRLEDGGERVEERVGEWVLRNYQKHWAVNPPTNQTLCRRGGLRHDTHVIALKMVVISVKTDARRKNTDDDGATDNVILKSSVGRSLFMLIMIYISVEPNDMQAANHVLGSTTVRRKL